MATLAETSKAIRGRARNLSIKTATSSGVSVHSSETDDTFSSGSFVHISNPSSGAAEPDSKKIEALLNTDWRTNRRPRADTYDPPKTAALAKPKISLKPALRVDTTRVTCDKIRDSPIDPDFIHSAPATKKEFALAEDAKNQRTDETNELQTSSGSSFDVHADLSDLILQNARIRDSLSFFRQSDNMGFSPTVFVTPVECSESSSQMAEFPLAKMKKVEEGQQLITQS
ncbi:hypothetical protein PG993_012331 [Apiospora rasikravindrae]|uniref:Uncharacterized protein n=1 Tax=Apiospora rasikravindrae TaxID=990691 RepID=A0ABR1S2A5_9PEZI